MSEIGAEDHEKMLRWLAKAVPREVEWKVFRIDDTQVKDAETQSRVVSSVLSNPFASFCNHICQFQTLF